MTDKTIAQRRLARLLSFVCSLAFGLGIAELGFRVFWLKTLTIKAGIEDPHFHHRLSDWDGHMTPAGHRVLAAHALQDPAFMTLIHRQLAQKAIKPGRDLVDQEAWLERFRPKRTEIHSIISGVGG